MSAGNCPSGSYCGQQGRCTPLLDVNAPCWNEVQCLHHVCRGNVCKMDACPQLNSDQDCPAGQFCSSSQRGNICVNRRADGEACSSDAQCQSYRCDGRRCRRDTCRTLLSRDGCPDGHICQQGQHGNLCVPLLARGASCSSDRNCRSDSCRAGRCYEDLCPTPLDTAGCDFSLLCVHTLIGNECMTKLTIGADCTANLQCLSNFCDNNQCRRPLAKNGDSCRFDNDCFSRNCFKGICRPSLASNGERCQFDDDCLSGNCFRGTCRPQGTGTEICQTNRDCLSGICIKSICSTPGTGTEVCRFNSDCPSGICINGICSPPDTGTEVCRTNIDCLSGNCINGICGPSLIPNGERCQLNDDCVSGNCFNGICRPPGTGGGGDKRPGRPCVSNSECRSGRCVAGACGIPLLDIGEDCSTAEATPANELCRSNRCDASTMLCARGVLETGAVCTDEQQCAGTCPPLEGLCVGDLIPQN
ncbi:prion-like-(Q/N-rich) domain-bearing protein 25 [Amphibalanus amphitrite]|uniref:prion-like-(Q/N-rich) domain-bearing protein 25 n=1 Tax=Amphibalanus amphitrite TaxID=1232801 RepID=UPI001C926184|nr:prion-like-(Q/N-rich) domain-bearing protein 25 [Amphibalanus amphitrite]